MSNIGDDGSESRRAKKPRLMAPPQGFQKGTTPLSRKIPAEKFTSEFDKAGAQPKTSKAARPNSDHRPMLAWDGVFEQSRAPSEPVASTSRAVHRLKPPNLALSPQPKSVAGPSSKRTIPITSRSYQPIVNPHLESTSEKTLPLSRRVIPLPPVPTKPSVALKPLAPPVLQTNASPKKEMKTIFTTRVARATDPMTDSGHAELLSIFLQDQRSLTSTYDRELHRGILSSPEKADRGKNPKFLRNGLADRANQILSKSHTAFSLWQREAETLISTRRLTPDLRLLITKVLHAAKLTDRFRPSAGWTGVVLCRLLHNKKSAETLKHDTCMVLLSSPTHSSDTSGRIPEGLEENGEIFVWQPWYQIDLPAGTVSDALHASGDLHEGQSGIALLCSRFLVNP